MLCSIYVTYDSARYSLCKQVLQNIAGQDGKKQYDIFQKNFSKSGKMKQKRKVLKAFLTSVVGLRVNRRTSISSRSDANFVTVMKGR